MAEGVDAPVLDEGDGAGDREVEVAFDQSQYVRDALANLRFAQEVEPANRDLQQRIMTEQAKRARGVPTVPSSIGLEKATNPFLRYREPAIVARLIAAGRLNRTQHEPVAAFAALREWKNNFR